MCVYTSTYTHTHTWAHTRTHTRIHTHAHACTHTCTCPGYGSFLVLIYFLLAATLCLCKMRNKKVSAASIGVRFTKLMSLWKALVPMQWCKVYIEEQENRQTFTNS